MGVLSSSLLSSLLLSDRPDSMRTRSSSSTESSSDKVQCKVGMLGWGHLFAAATVLAVELLAIVVGKA